MTPLMRVRFQPPLYSFHRMDYSLNTLLSLVIFGRQIIRKCVVFLSDDWFYYLVISVNKYCNTPQRFLCFIGVGKSHLHRAVCHGTVYTEFSELLESLPLHRVLGSSTSILDRLTNPSASCITMFISITFCYFSTRYSLVRITPFKMSVGIFRM